MRFADDLAFCMGASECSSARITNIAGPSTCGMEGRLGISAGLSSLRIVSTDWSISLASECYLGPEISQCNRSPTIRFAHRIIELPLRLLSASMLKAEDMRVGTIARLELYHFKNATELPQLHNEAHQPRF